MSNSIDPAVERTPPTVAAMKAFKDKLLNGHNVKASQFGLALPVANENTPTFYEQDPGDNSDEDPGEDFVESNVIDGYETAVAVEVNRVSSEMIMPKKDPVQMLADYLQHTSSNEEVTVIGPFGKLGFKALNVSITDYGVAFIIKKDAIQFEPNINTELTIQYKEEKYPVIYAGGFFTFPKIPFTFVSFLRVQPE